MFFRVIDPVKAVVEIRDYQHAVLRIAQTTLRATLGQHDLDDLLANQAAINELLKQIIDAATEPWGINVVKVETKDVDLPDEMKRAMARQAEAERERRAKVIAAEGEYQAAQRLPDAAGVISREHGALTLRTLQTLAEVATEHNSTLVFPIPMDILDAVREHLADGRPSVLREPQRWLANDRFDPRLVKPGSRRRPLTEWLRFPPRGSSSPGERLSSCARDRASGFVPGRSSDRELLLRGFERLSPESRYRRFLGAMPELRPEMVRYLTHVDHHDHEAIIALDEETGEGLGVARYVRNQDRPDVAEVAVTVIDDWQGRGLGTLLLDALSVRAREEGIRSFTALMLATNDEMMDLFRRLDPVQIVDRESGTVEIEVPIPEVGLAPALRKLLKISARTDVVVPLGARHAS